MPASQCKAGAHRRRGPVGGALVAAALLACVVWGWRCRTYQACQRTHSSGVHAAAGISSALNTTAPDVAARAADSSRDTTRDRTPNQFDADTARGRTRPVMPHPRPAVVSLATEVVLLNEAAQALARHDATQAFGALERYRERIAHPVLIEERDGLSVLAHCLAAEPDAVRRAAHYLTRHPHAVLVPRIEHSCLHAAESTN